MSSRILLLFLLLGGMMSAHAITPNSQEIDLANQIRNHSAQQRPQMIYDPVLNLVARTRARDLATRKYFSHTDPDGYGPNRLAQLAGYVLPAYWGTANGSNYIESLSAGRSRSSDVLSDWLNSPPHRTHVMGESDFYRAETRYGVGYAYDPAAPYQSYWVFISAPASLSAFPALQPYAEWLFERYTARQIDAGSDSEDADGDGLGRLQEFVLATDPKKKNPLPMPRLSTDGQRLEWNLPVRADLGAIRAEVQHCPGLSAWTTAGVIQSGTLYSSPATGSCDFLRLEITRLY